MAMLPLFDKYIIGRGSAKRTYDFTKIKSEDEMKMSKNLKGNISVEFDMDYIKDNKT